MSPELHQIFMKNCVFSLKMNLFVRKIWELQIVCGAEISTIFLQHLSQMLTGRFCIAFNIVLVLKWAMMEIETISLKNTTKVVQLGNYETGDVLLVTIFLINRSTLLKWKRQL